MLLSIKQAVDGLYHVPHTSFSTLGRLLSCLSTRYCVDGSTSHRLSSAVHPSNSVSAFPFAVMMLSRSLPLNGRLQRGARLVVSAAAPPVNVGVSSRSFVTARPAAHHLNSSDSGRLLHSGSWNRAAVAAAAHTLPPAAAAASPAAAAQQLSSDSLRSCAVALAKVADDTKALDISCLHVEPVVSWTSYMVLCTGEVTCQAVCALIVQHRIFACWGSVLINYCQRKLQCLACVMGHAALWFDRNCFCRQGCSLQEQVQGLPLQTAEPATWAHDKDGCLLANT